MNFFLSTLKVTPGPVILCFLHVLQEVSMLKTSFNRNKINSLTEQKKKKKSNKCGLLFSLQTVLVNDLVCDNQTDLFCLTETWVQEKDCTGIGYTGLLINPKPSIQLFVFFIQTAKH
ncbi:hypothetical protein AMECASPLE_030296 [Ameca splendens]|uniref:Uncharacterized protein n=1 Tax=Ameca splendens TaxID=208324 RepID=A0ABV0Y680_9TELE